jgi:hypothetical protein
MPVRKFRSVESMNQPHWRTPGDPRLFETIAALWAAGARMQRRRFPPGVHRHQSIGALDALVEQWHRDHVAQRRNRVPALGTDGRHEP